MLVVDKDNVLDNLYLSTDNNSFHANRIIARVFLRYKMTQSPRAPATDKQRPEAVSLFLETYERRFNEQKL